MLIIQLMVHLWASGHIGSNDIIFIGTDPVKHPKNAWKVVKKNSTTR